MMAFYKDLGKSYLNFKKLKCYCMMFLINYQMQVFTAKELFLKDAGFILK